MDIKDDIYTGDRVQVHVPYPRLVGSLDEILSEGINPEVYIDGVHLERVDSADLRLLRAGLDKYGATLTVHGPYLDMAPAGPDENKRLATVARLRKTFDIMEALGPTNVVFHSGYDGKAFGKDAGLWLENSLKTWPEFIERAGGLGITIGIENIFERTPDTLRSLMDRAYSPNFGVCIDAGHLNMFSTVPMEEWFAVLGGRLVEVHLHDNNGKGDEHLPVGEGSIDFPLFFALMREHARDPVLTIEQHGAEAVRRGLKAVAAYVRG